MPLSDYTLPTRSNLAIDPAQIVRTVELLRDRIRERFPGSGLSRLAEDLVAVAGATVRRLTWVSKPNLPVRIGAVLLILIIVGVTVGMLTFAFGPNPLDERPVGFAVLETLESLLNDIFLIGATIFFLGTIEVRIKRARALTFLRELRALAHIVDMHQLTKDPDRLLAMGTDTPSSPVRHMTRFELGRYFDYCTEMLSLISKIAALYAQTFDDPVVLQAVDEVETLTSSLAGKIWQKIVLLDTTAPIRS